MKLLIWLVVLVVAWPVALLALLLYPIAWLVSLPFRIVGISVRGALDFLDAVIRFPARLLRGSAA